MTPHAKGTSQATDEPEPSGTGKRCSRCGARKPVEEFYRNNGWKDCRHPWCKECFRAAQRDRWQRQGQRKTSRRWSRYQGLREDYFARLDTAWKAYVLGFLAADGYVVADTNEVRLELAVKDSSLLEAIRDDLCPGVALRGRDRTAQGRTASVMLTFSSPQITADLARYGVVPRKTATLEWPELPADSVRPYLLGYFDGDGFVTSCRRPNGRINYYWGLLGQPRFLESVIQVVQAAVGERIGGPWRKTPGVSVIRCGGHAARTIDQWLHEEGFGLERKRIPPE